MTSGGQCVMTAGTALMLQLSASSWDMDTQEVRVFLYPGLDLPNFIYILVYAGGIAYSNAHFGTGSGHIFMDDVQCSSSSSQLLECPSRPILSHNCLHSADAGVHCEGVFNSNVFN